MESQLQKESQNVNNFKDNSSDKLINLLNQKENIINDLKDKIERYPFILEKNEYLMSIIFYSSEPKFYYSMIYKNTDTIQKLEEKLFKKYPNFSEEESNYLYEGKLINKFQSFEKINIKNGDIII